MKVNPNLPETFPCEAPYCTARLSYDGDWPQLDHPQHGFFLFCDWRCLHVFCLHHAQTAFRDVRIKRHAEAVGT